MLAVIFCLAGVGLILYICEYLSSYKLLKGENQRKLAHICIASFVASWPWLISWRAIQFIGLAMLLGVLINRQEKYNFFGFNKTVKRQSYGDIFFALAITTCSLLTNNKIFFALAMLTLALADGLAAYIGVKYGKDWRYKVHNHTKTVIGSMAFWLISTFILGAGLLFAHDYIDFNHYVYLVVFLPPLLTMLENVSVMGWDDFVIPVAVIVALQLAS